MDSGNTPAMLNRARTLHTTAAANPQRQVPTQLHAHKTWRETQPITETEKTPVRVAQLDRRNWAAALDRCEVNRGAKRSLTIVWFDMYSNI
eukprot:9945184-Heterocapsa_arctica.AAC.1